MKFSSLICALLLITAACAPETSQQTRGGRNFPTLSAPTFVPALTPIAAANVASLTYLGRLDAPEPTSTVFNFDFSPDGTRLAALNNDLLIGWNLLDGAQLFYTARGEVIGVVTSPDKSELYAWRGTGEVLVLSATGGVLLATFNGTPNFANVSAYDPFEGWLALGALDGSFKVWDTAARESRATINAHTGRVLALAFSPDGSRIASAGLDGIVRIWSWASREQLDAYALEGSNIGITALRFSNDGRALAIGTSRDARLLQLDAEQIYTLDSGPVSSDLLMFSPDGRFLLAGSANAGLSLWNLDTAQLAARLDARGTALSAAFSAAGDLLLTSAFEGETALWNLAGMSESAINKAVLEVGTNQITDIAWSEDGVTVLLFDAVGAVYVWGVV